MNGLERDLTGRAAVLRLDLMSGIGREAARAFDVKVVPSMLVFDGTGELVLRQTGRVEAAPIREKVAELVRE